MKKLFLILMLLGLTLGASAQYVDADSTHFLKRAGCGLKLDGEKLSKDQANELLSNIGGEDYTSTWKVARDWRTAGIAMTAGGGAITVVGLGVTMVYALAGVLGAAFGGAIGGAVGGPEAGSDAAEGVIEGVTPYINGGLATAFIGATTMAAGIPLIVIHCNRMNHIVKSYNELNQPAAPQLPAPSEDVYLSFGPTAHGTGIALNF
ncbi:MAG: hypothetical protein J6Y31_06625 [Bacteroidales bacterium]|nr:hypothetical protein [Bacteroidales bacterium]MBP5374567.1 hypothetical protein [Bacteroidales bacterium]